MEKTLKFLAKLKKNNDRDWFKANKKEYNEARAEFEAAVEDLIERIAAFDPELIGTAPKDCLFRIYRDIRFSKDKSPYKTAFGAYIAPGGRKSMAPGYYFHVEPKATFLAGGLYRPDGPVLLNVRNAIAGDPKALPKIEKQAAFKKNFGKIESHENLKNAPKGFDPEHPAIEYLKMKDFICHQRIGKDAEVKDRKFTAQAAKVFKSMKPLIDFLRAAAEKSGK